MLFVAARHVTTSRSMQHPQACKLKHSALQYSLMRNRHQATYPGSLVGPEGYKA